MRHQTAILFLATTLLARNICGQDWKTYASWCVSDTGSSHRLYMSSCRVSDQFDSLMICQRDAASHHPEHGKAARAINDAGRAAVDQYMEDKKPKRCKPSK